MRQSAIAIDLCQIITCAIIYGLQNTLLVFYYFCFLDDDMFHGENLGEPGDYSGNLYVGSARIQPA